MKLPGRERLEHGLLLAPFVVGVGTLVAIPAAVTFALAVFEYDLLTEPHFVGRRNFSEMVRDPIFGRALVNSLVFMAIAVPLRMVAAVGLALLLHARFRGAGAGRTAAYLPTVVPDAAWALVWVFMLNPFYGPINAVLGAVGGPTPAWLGTGAGAMTGIVMMSCFTIGEGFVVALATRQELPNVLFEVARLEGSSRWHTLRKLTLPLMAPTLALLAFRDTAFSLQATFAPAYLLTDGGPDRATLFVPLHIYDVAFENLRYGYGAAMTLTLFVVTLGIVLAQRRLLQRWRFSFEPARR